jgi:hypothetical protein
MILLSLRDFDNFSTTNGVPNLMIHGDNTKINECLALLQKVGENQQRKALHITTLK